MIQPGHLTVRLCLKARLVYGREETPGAHEIADLPVETALSCVASAAGAAAGSRRQPYLSAAARLSMCPDLATSSDIIRYLARLKAYDRAAPGVA